MKCALEVVGGQSRQNLSERPSLLVDGQTRAAVASSCRTAALDFLAGVAEGWTKFDLALWLHGPYALATRHSQQGERSAVSQRRRALPENTIEKLLVQTRGRLLAALERAVLADGHLDEMVEHALIEGHVRHAVDDAGAYVWVPVDNARMRLEDRVASLFVADYMNDRSEYRNLYVCHHCESVVFEADARERGMCGAHRMISVVVPKDPLARALAPTPLPLVTPKGSSKRTLVQGSPDVEALKVELPPTKTKKQTLAYGE